jgi:hypothetical protein
MAAEGWRLAGFSNFHGHVPCGTAAQPLHLTRLFQITVTANMDRASEVLAQDVAPGVPNSYRALADHGDVPRSTLHHRARGRRSREDARLC